MTKIPDHEGDQSQHSWTMARNLAKGNATVRDPVGFAMSEDRYFVADFDNLTPSTGEQYAATFENPTTDTSAIIVAEIIEASSVARPNLLKNPSSDTPSTTRTTRSMRFGTDEASTDMVARADTQSNEMTAGTGEDTGIRFTVPADYRVLPFRALVEPQTTIGISGSGGLVGENIDLSLLYYEVAV